MPKEHYWTNFRVDDDDETSMSTVSPFVVLSSALRDKSDTLIRAIMWAKLVATVGTSSLPNLDWIAGAFVDYLLFFDTESDGHAVNLDDQDPHQVGFLRLNQSVWTTPTTNKYSVMFQGPNSGVRTFGQRKGYSASNLPSLSIQRWVSDNHGVFDNFAGYSLQLTSRVAGRALWASDFPAP